VVLLRCYSNLNDIDAPLHFISHSSEDLMYVTDYTYYNAHFWHTVCIQSDSFYHQIVCILTKVVFLMAGYY